MDLDYQTILMKTTQNNGSYNKGKKRKSNPLKVVYISSPMKVKTSASKFRSLVQHLTGKNSDISQYIDESSYSMNGVHEIGFDENEDGMFLKEGNKEERLSTSISSMDNTPTSSENYLGHMDNVFGSNQMESIKQFDGDFSSYFDSSRLDHVLGSYEDLLL